MLALLAGLTDCYTRMDVAIPPQNVAGATPPEKPLTSVLTLPGGNGPFPAIVVLDGCDGCDGVQEQEQAWAGG